MPLAYVAPWSGVCYTNKFYGNNSQNKAKKKTHECV